ncbi:MAG: diacylglycerol kinase family protein [Lachnospiraceae bacterium]|nr:diacylglycerol kinase family protein [Lachnospiraceae bacterium]
MKHALDGIRAGLVNEPNMMIHFCAAVVVIVFGLTIKLTILEWSICLILCGLVIALELMNTAVEAVVDLVTKDFDKQAKLAKDTAAGAVLVAAIVAAVVGGLIFVPKIILLFQGG